MEINFNQGVFLVNGRPSTNLLNKLVTNRIFYFLGSKLTMGQIRITNIRINHKRMVGSHVVGPINGRSKLVKGFITIDRSFCEKKKHANRGSEADISLIDKCQIAFKRSASLACLDICPTKGQKFRCKNIFESFCASCKKFKLIYSHEMG